MRRLEALVLGLMCAGSPTYAFDNGEHGDMPANVRSWFKSVKSPHGVPCCDAADGHRTTWEKHPGSNNYWVPIEGEWREVPPDAVVYDAGNPTGESIVWYVRQGTNTYYIRCMLIRFEHAASRG